MVLISYMSIPITTKNGETQYVKVDLLNNCVKINNHEVESFESMAEDAEMFSSSDGDGDGDDDGDDDCMLPDYMKSVSRESVMHACQTELEKLEQKQGKSEADAFQLNVLKMLLNDMLQHPVKHDDCECCH